MDHKILEESRENVESEIDILKNQVLTLKNEKSRLKTEKLLVVPSKGKKDHVDDTQVNLENMISVSRQISMMSKSEPKVLQEDLRKARNELRRTLQWTRSSRILTSLHEKHNTSGRQGLGYNEINTTNKSMGVYISSKRLCFHCGDNGHFKDTCKARVKSIQTNKHYVEKRREEQKKNLVPH